MKQSLPKIITVILSACLALFIISFSVVATLNFRPLYYFDIKHLEIEDYSGYSYDTIRENYDVLIDYNSIFNRGELNFPSLEMSESGRIHFVEVKDIFVAVQLLCIETFILSLAGIFYQRKVRDYVYLKATAIATVTIPTVLAIVIGLNWEKTFVTFHKIFFNNDYWIFDDTTDPVITILPDTFFLHCALMIVGLIIIGSIICYLIYRKIIKLSQKKMNS